MRKVILLIQLIFWSQFLYAEEPEVFPVSTEIQIGKIRNLIERAPAKGVYVSVGGERAFRSASMYKGVESLVIFDISPTIIRFNKINVELLKAENKEQYKKLRWESDFAKWQETSKDLTEADFKWWNDNIRTIKGYDFPETLNKTGRYDKYIKIRDKLLSIYSNFSKKFNNRESVFLQNIVWAEIEKSSIITKEEFDWFDKERKTPESCVQKFIQAPSTAIDLGKIVDYKSGNYLFDDVLYGNLHRLAMEKKINVIEANLSTPEGLNKIKSVVLVGKLAVLDLDNLYVYDYMGEENYQNAIRQLVTLGSKESILIVMHNYKNYACAQFSIYIGFTFEHIKSWTSTPFLDSFINGLPVDVLPLLDGRLYEGGDELPKYLQFKNA
jgi:hypothetical protein